MKRLAAVSGERLVPGVLIPAQITPIWPPTACRHAAPHSRSCLHRLRALARQFPPCGQDLALLCRADLAHSFPELGTGRRARRFWRSPPANRGPRRNPVGAAHARRLRSPAVEFAAVADPRHDDAVPVPALVAPRAARGLFRARDRRLAVCPWIEPYRRQRTGLRSRGLCVRGGHYPARQARYRRIASRLLPVWRAHLGRVADRAEDVVGDTSRRRHNRPRIGNWAASAQTPDD